MATDKKSFLIYCDIIHTVEQLTDEQAGDLFKHLLRYVNDLNPQSDSVITKIAFEPIRQALKRDLDKYETIRKRNSDNGAKGGRPIKPKETQITQPFFQEPKQADSVIDSDSVIDIKVNKGFIKPTIQEIEIYMQEKGMENLAERFYYFYEAKGWVIGKNKIKDWKSCVMTWKKNSENNTTTPQVINRKVFNLREYDERT
jgi:hypothetical protein